MDERTICARGCSACFGALVADEELAPFDAKAFWTEIDALGGGDLFLDGPPADPPPMPDPRKFFDE